MLDKGAGSDQRSAGRADRPSSRSLEWSGGSVVAAAIRGLGSGALVGRGLVPVLFEGHYDKADARPELLLDRRLEQEEASQQNDQ